MKPLRRFAPCLLILAGLLLAGASLSRGTALLHHHRNPFAVQQSAYGKLMARLSESTIDRVWHLGVEQVVPHGMVGHECGPECRHHPEEGEEEEEFVYHVADHQDDPGDDEHDHGDGEPAHDGPLEAGKRWFQERVLALYRRTNPYSLSKAHLASVHRDIEGMLLRSFKLDPTHYGAYDSYHLFLTTHDFGGSPQRYEQARKIADFAIAAAFRENEDPEPWLTAAAADMNLFQMDSAPHLTAGEPIPLGILEKYRQRIGFSLQRFEELQAKSEAVGTWRNHSAERQEEILHRYLFCKRTSAQFDALIARSGGGAPTGKTSAPAADTAQPGKAGSSRETTTENQ